jgi:hypothetical protein
LHPKPWWSFLAKSRDARIHYAKWLFHLPYSGMRWQIDLIDFAPSAIGWPTPIN